MGREIRRAPKGWEHPKYKDDEVRHEHQRGAYHPMFDTPFSEAMDEWYAGWKKWEAGERDEGADPDSKYWDWYGSPPDPAYYRHEDWTDEQATCVAVYETVSEGTPVTPFFETKEALVDYLVEHGDSWDQKRGDGGWSRDAAEGFVGRGWAPSMMVSYSASGTQVLSPRDGI